MPRSYSPDSVIQLPRLDAASALALLAALLTVARLVKKVPAQIADAIARLASAHRKVEEALSTRLLPADPRGQRAADTDEDSAWSALHSWLTGFARLPPRYREAASASQMLSVLFPDGLKFTKLVYKQEWAEVESRIVRLKKDGFDRAIESMGGKALLDFIYASHTAYGQALGITVEKGAAGEGGGAVREALDEATAALRSFALRVASWGDEGNAAVAERLMAPLTSWESAAPESAPAASPQSPVVAAQPEPAASETRAAAGK